MIRCNNSLLLLFNSCYLSGWELVAEKKECDGSEVSKGKKSSLEDCATECRGTASVFAFGTNDYGTIRCNDAGCTCLCETSATVDGSCDQVNHNGFRLYKYLGKGNTFV